MCGRSILFVALTVVAASTAAPTDVDQILGDNPIVLPKRAALVLDRLLVALQNALREEVEGAGVGARGGSAVLSPGERGEEEGISAPAALRARTVYDDYTSPSAVLTDETGRTMDLQRRGHSGGGRGRVLRCYFNAVTCFRK